MGRALSVSAYDWLHSWMLVVEWFIAGVRRAAL
jgi:hypothetical protein